MGLFLHCRLVSVCYLGFPFFIGLVFGVVLVNSTYDGRGKHVGSPLGVDLGVKGNILGFWRWEALYR